MKKLINTTAQTVTFEFDGLDSVTLSMTKVSPANATYAMLHGFAARVGDAAAITKSAENGFKVTEAMRRAEVVAMTAFYEDATNDNWNQKVSTKKPVFNPTIQAIAEKRNCTYEEAMAWFNAKLMAELSAM